MMRPTEACLASGIQSTEAGPATCRDGELLLERSIVAGPAGDMYYAGISLRQNPDGSLGLVWARKRRLDNGGLSPGDYMVLVNNEAMGFTIEDLHDDE